MTTDQQIDPSETTPAMEPLSPDAAQPSQEPTETVEELKEKLAAAETEANRWKGRVEKANEKKKTAVAPADLEELEWKLENKSEIELVKPEYEKLLAEGYLGEPVSKKVALALALKEAKVDTSATKRGRSDDMHTPSVNTRNIDPTGYESDVDREFGLTIEKKRKLEQDHPQLRELRAA